jgi:hypothetical protein
MRLSTRSNRAALFAIAAALTVPALAAPAAADGPILGGFGCPCTIQEGDTLHRTATASHPHGLPLTLETEDMPTGAAFVDNGDGTVSLIWTPGFDQAGEYRPTLRVTDGTSVAERRPRITVLNVNRAPEIWDVAASALHVNEGASFSFLVSVRDLDNGPLTFAAPTRPEGATIAFDSAADSVFRWRFAWRTSFGDAGSHAVTVRATDGEATVSRSFVLRVEEVRVRVVSDGQPHFRTAAPGDSVALEAFVVNEGALPVLVNLTTTQWRSWPVSSPAPMVVPGGSARHVSVAAVAQIGDPPNRITLASRPYGAPEGYGRVLNWLLSVPIAVDVSFDPPLPGLPVTGKVKTWYLDGSPAGGIRVTLEERSMWTVSNALSGKAEVTTNAEGSAAFQLAGAASLPGQHTVSARAWVQASFWESQTSYWVP